MLCYNAQMYALFVFAIKISSSNSCFDVAALLVFFLKTNKSHETQAVGQPVGRGLLCSLSDYGSFWHMQIAELPLNLALLVNGIEADLQVVTFSRFASFLLYLLYITHTIIKDQNLPFITKWNLSYILFKATLQ